MCVRAGFRDERVWILCRRSDGYDVQGVSGAKCILGILSRAKLAASKRWAWVSDWLWTDVVAVDAGNWVIAALPIFALPLLRRDQKAALSR